MRTLVFILTIFLGTCIIIAPLAFDFIVFMEQLHPSGGYSHLPMIQQFPGIGFYRFGCWFTGTGMIIAGLLGTMFFLGRKEKSAKITANGATVESRVG